jgi:hypothetical protein
MVLASCAELRREAAIECGLQLLSALGHSRDLRKRNLMASKIAWWDLT